MGGTWIVSLEHMLDEEGNIAAPKGPARNLAKHIVSIVAMASRPEIIPLPENTKCVAAVVPVGNHALE